MLLAPQKVRVLKALLIRTISSFVKIIHVKLPYEGREIVVLKKLGQHLVAEFVYLSHDESIAGLVPANDFVEALIVDDIKGLNQERRDVGVQISSATFWPHCFWDLRGLHHLCRLSMSAVMDLLPFDSIRINRYLLFIGTFLADEIIALSVFLGIKSTHIVSLVAEGLHTILDRLLLRFQFFYARVACLVCVALLFWIVVPVAA